MKIIPFPDLELPQELEKAITDLGFEEPTPIQEPAIPNRPSRSIRHRWLDVHVGTKGGDRGQRGRGARGLGIRVRFCDTTRPPRCNEIATMPLDILADFS
jgi:hypothetical protein